MSNALSSNVLGPGITAVLTTAGDLLYVNAAGELVRLPIGAATEILTVVGGLPDWEPGTPAILTTNGDLLYRNGAGAVTRLPVGAADEVLTVVGGLPDWEPPSGRRYWQPFAAPDTPNAKDDEFNDASLSGAWTEWDVANWVTFSEGNGGLLVTGTGNGNDRCAGIYKTAPVGAYTVWAYLSQVSPRTDYLNIGILLGEDLAGNPATSDFYGVVLGRAAASDYFQAEKWTSYTVWSALLGNVLCTAEPRLSGAFVRTRMSGVAMAADFSLDGRGWYNYYSGNLAFTPAQIGLCFYFKTNGVQKWASCPFFRVTAGNSFESVLAGSF